MTASVYLSSRPSALVLRLGPEGLSSTAARRSRALPWSKVADVYCVDDRVGPVVCVKPVDPLALVPRGPLWRLNARANTSRYGVPVAVPLLDTNLHAGELLDVMRHYCGGREEPVRQPAGVTCFSLDSLPAVPYRRFRRRLLVSVTVLATILVALIWALVGVGIAVAPAVPVLQSVLFAVAGTVILVALTMNIYEAVLPYGRTIRRRRS